MLLCFNEGGMSYARQSGRPPTATGLLATVGDVGRVLTGCVHNAKETANGGMQEVRWAASTTGLAFGPSVKGA